MLSLMAPKQFFKKITNVWLWHDAQHLNIDDSKIKNVTARLLWFEDLSKDCVQISRYMEEKHKSFMDFRAKIAGL